MPRRSRRRSSPRIGAVLPVALRRLAPGSQRYTATAGAATVSRSPSRNTNCQPKHPHAAVAVTVQPSPTVSVPMIARPSLVARPAATLTWPRALPSPGPGIHFLCQWVSLAGHECWCGININHRYVGNYTVTTSKDAVTSSPATNLTVTAGSDQGIPSGEHRSSNFQLSLLAVNYINTNSVNGNLTFNVAAGYNETAPHGWLHHRWCISLTERSKFHQCSQNSLVSPPIQVTAHFKTAGR